MSEVDGNWGEEILQMLDARLARLEKEARAGSDFAAEARDELRVTRLAWGSQIDLTREALIRNGELFRASVDALSEIRAEVRAQTEAIWKMIDRMDRLDGGTSPA